jgi:guanosine-diphosphatase
MVGTMAPSPSPPWPLLLAAALLPLLLLLQLLPAALATAGEDAAFEYAVVCDAGSTGTRAYVYSLAAGAGARVQAQRAAKVKPGLSTFGSRPSEAVDYLMELVADATPLVPAHLRSRTPLFVRATAGMRLLPSDQQQAVYDALFEGLRARQGPGGGCPFVIRRENFATLTGDEEGFFGLLAVNYLKDTLGPDLLPATAAATSGGGLGGRPRGIIGALDLGGSSTQISFSTQRGTPADDKGRPRALEPRDTYVCNDRVRAAEQHSYIGRQAHAGRQVARQLDRQGDTQKDRQTGMHQACRPVTLRGIHPPAHHWTLYPPAGTCIATSGLALSSAARR